MNTDQQSQLTKKERRGIKRENKEAEKARTIEVKKNKKYLAKGVIIIAILAAIAGIWKLTQQPPTPPVSPSDILQTQSDDWTKGNTDSKVVLVEYLDFECEACGAYYPLVKRLSEEYGDKVLFVSRYFPLSGHKNGMNSALAVESAGRQGKYWEMHNLLFENQRSWGEQKTTDASIFEKYAEQLGLDMKQFKRDTKSKEVKERVIRDRNSGAQLNVRGTPTFFLGGEKIRNPRGYEEFKSLIDRALGR